MRSLITAFLLIFVAGIFAADQNSAGIDPVDSARREFQNGKFDSALAILAEAEKRAPLSGRGLDIRGCILIEQGKFDEALGAFAASREKDLWFSAFLHAGDAQVRQKKWDAARDAYSAGIKATDVLILNERFRFGIFVSYLGAKDEENAQKVFGQIIFPTESAAYYYAQAAWAFAHGKDRDAQNWIKRADGIYPAQGTTWFARHLYDFGWLKSKPGPSAD